MINQFINIVEQAGYQHHHHISSENYSQTQKKKNLLSYPKQGTYKTKILYHILSISFYVLPIVTYHTPLFPLINGGKATRRLFFFFLKFLMLIYIDIFTSNLKVK